VGKTITVTVTASGAATTGSVTSAPTAAVVLDPPTKKIVVDFNIRNDGSDVAPDFTRAVVSSLDDTILRRNWGEGCWDVSVSIWVPWSDEIVFHSLGILS